jgi:methionyl aminopeptidase
MRRRTVSVARRGQCCGDVDRERVTTGELDEPAGRVFARHGARSAPKVVYDAPCEIFISVNDEAVHGIRPHPPGGGCGAATS